MPLDSLLGGRLQVTQASDGKWRFSDRLLGRDRELDRAAWPSAGAQGLDATALRLGFLDAALPPALRAVATLPATADDHFFWQFPCITEAAAFGLHQALAEAPDRDGAVHTYLGLPWATWIDHGNRHGGSPPDVQHELTMQRVRIGGFHRAFRSCGLALRVHTVCQHVYWRDWIATWREVGVTDLWLSHAPAGCTDDAAAGAGIELHPWRLYAVNVEDTTRTAGLRIGVDPAAKPLLASFVGAHADHYLSDVRLRLRGLAGEPGFHVQFTDKWHFEDIVYEHQVYGRPLSPQDALQDSVARYNAILSDSVFSLCPSGAGPNTLRLWESMAVGAVPVLLGPPPELPRGGTLEPIDWDSIALRVGDDEIAALPQRLRAVPIEEVRRRQALAMRAFAAVQQQRCF